MMQNAVECEKQEEMKGNLLYYKKKRENVALMWN